ncbi:hypothetical protein SDC9_27308 [bioreactor metagenome]|uniref:Uncharacterized protein n=1 Tax=bioreactor metagenome TaxID=1076179 RepID=A0A644UQW4_9ZZZZ
MEEGIRNEQAHPDDEAEQAHDVHNCKAANAFFLQLAEVGHQTDAEEGQQEEHDAEAVEGASHGLAELVQFRRRQAEEQQDQEGAKVPQHEAGETIHNVAPGHGALATGFVELGSPDVGEDQGPHANEHVDEYLDGGGHHHDPAWLPLGAEASHLGKNQGFSDGAAGDSAAVRLNGKAHPATGHHGFGVQEVLRDKGQDQHFDAGEHHDQRGNHDRHHRPGADGAAGGNGRRDAADGNARSKGSGPFLIELEVLTSHVVNNGPIQQISFNNGAQASENNVTGKTGGVGGLHAKFGTKNNDGDLDEKFGAAGFAQGFSKTGRKVAQQNTHDQGHNKASLGAQTKRPGDALLGDFRGVGCNVGVGANSVAGDGNEENAGKTVKELADVALHELDAHRHDGGNEHIAGDQSPHARQCALRGRSPAIQRAFDPHAHFEAPAQQIQASELAQRQQEDEAADKQGYFVFIIGFC